MEFEKNMDHLPSALKAKTSQRIKYEAQVGVIKKQLGDLEMIRESLGLSQRKICQLLMVDPSAWTRWVRETGAPPHIYRALQWYMALNEKFPGLGNAYWLSSVAHGTSGSASEGKTALEGIAQFESQLFQLKNEQVRIQKELNRYKKTSFFLLVFLSMTLLLKLLHVW